MLENLTTGEKVIAGATAVGIAALIFHKPTRNAVGLADGRKRRNKDVRLNNITKKEIEEQKKDDYFTKYNKNAQITTKYNNSKYPKYMEGGRSKVIYVDGLEWVTLTPIRNIRRVKKNK